MLDSKAYPGLCKPYEVEHNAGNAYVDLAFNSINLSQQQRQKQQQQQQPQQQQQKQQPPQTPYYTYKTYNTEYDNQRMVGTSSSTRNNIQTPQFSTNRNGNYNTNVNNEAHSYNNQRQERPPVVVVVQQQQQQQQKTANQQQYTNQGGSYQSRYPTSPFQQAFDSYQQQHYQKRLIDKKNPYHTYRWDLLFKNYL